MYGRTLVFLNNSSKGLVFKDSGESENEGKYVIIGKYLLLRLRDPSDFTESAFPSMESLR
jgi:hypothetical protein